mmetsp:Transcript_35698/g.81086  ORF Transcript_35698/g.81086 Transcript_35698/m.81086 type:complete len:324 (-) Transcript_35698:211-1182(-)
MHCGHRRGRPPRPHCRGAVRRPRDPAHGSLPALMAAVVRWPYGCQRGLLREERRASVLLAHARPVGGAPRGEHRHVRRVPRAYVQVQHSPRDGAGRDRWRGGWCRQLRRRLLQAVHPAGRGLRGLQGTQGRRGRHVHRRCCFRQRARRLRPGQRRADPRHPAQHAEVHQRAGGIARGLQAGQLRLPRWLRLLARGHPLRHRGRHHQDEHRHRHPVGLLGRHARVRGEVPRLPPGPDRQPGGRDQAQQEVLRSPHAAPVWRGDDGLAPGRSHGRPELPQRALNVLQLAGGVNRQAFQVARLRSLLPRRVPLHPIVEVLFLHPDA